MFRTDENKVIEDEPEKESHFHCVKINRIWGYSGLHFPAFGLNTDQNNSEYGQFLRNFLDLITIKNLRKSVVSLVNSNIPEKYYTLAANCTRLSNYCRVLKMKT